MDFVFEYLLSMQTLVLVLIVIGLKSSINSFRKIVLMWSNVLVNISPQKKLD